MPERKTAEIEAVMNPPYWVADILPCQVPAGGEGQYFAVERYYLEPPRIDEIRRKYADILLKLNCFRDLTVYGGDCNPEPGALYSLAGGRQDVLILANEGKTLFEIRGEETYMTIYHPDEEMLELLRKLTEAEGLFLWQPAEGRL